MMLLSWSHLSGDPAGAQELLTAGDVVGLEAPAPDHRIAYGTAPLQFGHLRLPEGEGPHPVVVFIHGGCWLSAYDIAHVGGAEAALAEEGYAVWSLEYRRVGDEGGGWPGTFLDVASGADHLRTLAGDYPLDLSRVVAAGHSAGGQLALWLAARPRVDPASEIHANDPLPIQGVFALAPAAALWMHHESGVCGSVVDALMGGGPADQPARYDAASPVRLAPIGVPQTVFVGAHDGTWGPSGRAYHEAATAAGDTDAVLVVAPESGHFEMIVPRTTTWPLVVEALADLYRRLPGG